MGNLLEVLEDRGCFKTLLRACDEGGLEAMLASEGDFTIFAPTDDAFKDLGSKVVDNLFSQPHYVMDLVLFHSVEWVLTSKELVNATKLRTLSEDNLNIKSKKKKGIWVENAKIVELDVPADNGIIHIIDKVIIPPELADIIWN